MSGFDELKNYVEIDTQKFRLIEDLLNSSKMEMQMLQCKELEMPFDFDEDYVEDSDYSEEKKFSLKEISLPHKFCPKCGQVFPADENFCPDCLVALKYISDKIDIKDIKTDSTIRFEGANDYSDILTPDCFSLIDDFDFTMDDFNEILFSIRSQAFKNMDKLIKDNSIDLDDLYILDKVILFAKSFADVEYKSFGETLGYFELNRIYVDDRQSDSLQITTLIHELTHFLIKEIFSGTICKILDCSKNKHIESVVTYILNYSDLNRMIDEYAAHSVEGRFTVFGYQDYSSFIALQGELDEEYVDMAKTIGNTFSIYIKDLLEGFLDWDVRSEIKDLFLSQTIDRPDYSQLKFENCNKLSDEGFLKAIWLILSEIENADAKKVRDLELEF